MTTKSETVYRWIIGIMATLIIGLVGGFIGERTLNAQVRDHISQPAHPVMLNEMVNIKGDIAEIKKDLREIRNLLTTRP